MSEKIKILGQQYDMPEGIEHVGPEDLYLVDRQLIDLAPAPDIDDFEEELDNYFNARHFTSKGFDNESMDRLLTSIMDDGLINPLICRWVVEDDDIRLQIIEGERRVTCIDKLISESKSCWSRIDQEYSEAEEVFKRIPCRIVVANPKEALRYSWMVQENTIDWGDGAKTVAIYRMRSQNLSDDEILEITGKSLNWLREEDKICSLDKKTFSYYISGKIIRKVALDLVKIESEDVRAKYLEKAYEFATKRIEVENKRIEEDIEVAEDNEEIAEANLAVAEYSGTDQQVEMAAENYEAAKKKTKEKRKKKKKDPVAKTKDLTAASAEVNEEMESQGEVPPEPIVNPVRAGGIRKMQETLQGLIDEDGHISDSVIIEPKTLRYCIAVLKAILDGEKDVISRLERQWKVEKIMARRQESTAAIN